MNRLCFFLCCSILISCTGYRKIYETKAQAIDFASDGYDIYRQYGHPYPVLNFRTGFKDYTYNRKVAKLTNIQKSRDSIRIVFLSGFTGDTVIVKYDNSVIFSGIVPSLNDINVMSTIDRSFRISITKENEDPNILSVFLKNGDEKCIQFVVSKRFDSIAIHIDRKHKVWYITHYYFSRKGRVY